MSTATVSAIAGYTLIIVGLWSKYDSGSKTAFIPVILGVLMLVLNQSVRAGGKGPRHMALFFTVVAMIGLGKPFLQQISQGDTDGIFRSGLMIAVCSVAFIFFVRDIFLGIKKKKSLKK